MELTIYYPSQDASQAWEGHEYKKWVVRVQAGPRRRPILDHDYYARAKTAAGAAACVQRDAIGIPRNARFAVRLASPRDLGCVSTPI